MRQQKSETKSGKCCISIHAPLAGCDHKHSLRKKGEQLFQSTHPLRGATTINRRDMFKNDFNPRTPCGVRLYFFSQTFDIDKFQSTHPLRGATCRLLSSRLSILFQSTHPLRGATSLAGLKDLVVKVFQSTHPLRGATISVLFSCFSMIISIHAPLAGCDHNAASLFFIRQNFNPRTPCGVRPAKDTNSPADKEFQSTHPLRGATVYLS